MCTRLKRFNGKLNELINFFFFFWFNNFKKLLVQISNNTEISGKKLNLRIRLYIFYTVFFGKRMVVIHRYLPRGRVPVQA